MKRFIKIKKPSEYWVVEILGLYQIYPWVKRVITKMDKRGLYWHSERGHNFRRKNYYRYYVYTIDSCDKLKPLIIDTRIKEVK